MGIPISTEFGKTDNLRRYFLFILPFSLEYWRNNPKIMNKYFFILLFIAFLQPSFAQEKIWLEEQVYQITSLDDESFEDLSFLKEELEGKRIVQLGESSHGIGDYYQLKSRLVKYLHQELGYEVLAMEGGFADINLAYADRDILDAKTLMRKSLFGNFQCEGMLTAFEYLKETADSDRPLVLTGFDCQSSSSYFQTFMGKLLKDYDPKLARRFEEDFKSSFSLYQEMKDSALIMNSLAKNSSLYTDLHAFLNSHKKEIKSRYPNEPQLLPILYQSLKTFEDYWNFSFEEISHFKNSTIRDELMAQNLIWLAEHAYPDKKLILWAHNAHVQKGEAGWTNPDGVRPKLQGELLDKYFGEENYVIGLFSIRGESYQHWTQSYISFDHRDKEYLAEYKFKDLAGPIHYLPLSQINKSKANKWLFKPITVYQVETGGEFQVDPWVEIYDAVIVLDKVKRPNYFH